MRTELTLIRGAFICDDQRALPKVGSSSPLVLSSHSINEVKTVIPRISPSIFKLRLWKFLQKLRIACAYLSMPKCPGVE